MSGDIDTTASSSIGGRKHCTYIYVIETASEASEAKVQYHTSCKVSVCDGDEYDKECQHNQVVFEL